MSLLWGQRATVHGGAQNPAESSHQQCSSQRHSVTPSAAQLGSLGVGELQQHHGPGGTTRGTLLPPINPSLPPLRPGWDTLQQGPAGTHPRAAQPCSVTLLGATEQKKFRLPPAKKEIKLLLVLP